QRWTWRCAVVADDTVRLGFCVVNGLQEEHAHELVKQRQDWQFDSLEDFKRRVSLSKEELRTLAALGALNCFAGHRRAAMWRVEEQAPEALFAVAGDGDPRSSTSTLSPTGCTDPRYHAPPARRTVSEAV